jgi:Flp pilus assembly protein TadD
MIRGACASLILLTLALTGCRGKLDLAAIQVERGKWESAAKLYREYLADHPQSAIALRSLSAIECNRLREYEQCAEHADRLLATMPRDSQGVGTGVYAYTLLADKAAQMQDTARVRAYLDRIAKIYYEAGYWNYMNEGYNVAEKQLRNAVRLKPDDPLAYLRLGILFWNKHMDDSSIVWFERAAEVDPLNEDALIDLIVMYRETGQGDKALRTYDRLAHARKVLYPDSVFVTEVDTTRPPMLDYRGERPSEDGP